jgi:hypothetical protein
VKSVNSGFIHWSFNMTALLCALPAGARLGAVMFVAIAGLGGCASMAPQAAMQRLAGKR